MRLTATVTRVAPAEGSHQGQVTVTIPGYPVPITLPAGLVPDADA